MSFGQVVTFAACIPLPESRVLQAFLVVNGLILSAFALGFLWSLSLLEKLVGLFHSSPNALVEVTAFYGGLDWE